MERRGMCGELREEVVGKLQLNIIHKRIKLKNLSFYDTLSGQYLQFHFVQWSFWLRPGFLVFTNTWETRRSNWVAFCHKGFWRPLFYSSHKRQRRLFHGKIPTTRAHGILAKVGQKKKNSLKAETCFYLPSISL